MKSLIVALSLLLGAFFVQAAPAPFTRPLRQVTYEELIGLWKYKYGPHANGMFLFLPWGRFENNLGDTKYEGTWSIDAKGDVVTLERCVYHMNGVIKYGTENKFTFRFPHTNARKGYIKKLDGDCYTNDNNHASTTVNLEK